MASHGILPFAKFTAIRVLGFAGDLRVAPVCAGAGGVSPSRQRRADMRVAVVEIETRCCRWRFESVRGIGGDWVPRRISCLLHR